MPTNNNTILAIIAIIIASVSAIIAATGVSVDVPEVPITISGEVPIGAVIDFYCPGILNDVACIDIILPEEYMIADGSIVDDPESIFHGKRLPDLTDRFVLGTYHFNNVGKTGGSYTHAHETSFQIPTIGIETGNHPDKHHHVWSNWDTSENNWESYSNIDSPLSFQKIKVMKWANGMDKTPEGAGFFPFGVKDGAGGYGTTDLELSTEYSGSTHNHDLKIPPTTIDLPSSGIHSAPPYMKLVKAIRIK